MKYDFLKKYKWYLYKLKFMRALVLRNTINVEVTEFKFFCTEIFHGDSFDNKKSIYGLKCGFWSDYNNFVDE